METGRRRRRGRDPDRLRRSERRVAARVPRNIHVVAAAPPRAHDGIRPRQSLPGPARNPSTPRARARASFVPSDSPARHPRRRHDSVFAEYPRGRRGGASRRSPGPRRRFPPPSPRIVGRANPAFRQMFAAASDRRWRPSRKAPREGPPVSAQPSRRARRLDARRRVEAHVERRVDLRGDRTRSFLRGWFRAVGSPRGPRDLGPEPSAAVELGRRDADVEEHAPDAADVVGRQRRRDGRKPRAVHRLRGLVKSPDSSVARGAGFRPNARPDSKYSPKNSPRRSGAAPFRGDGVEAAAAAATTRMFRGGGPREEKRVSDVWSPRGASRSGGPPSPAPRPPRPRRGRRRSRGAFRAGRARLISRARGRLRGPRPLGVVSSWPRQICRGDVQARARADFAGARRNGARFPRAAGPLPNVPST